MKSTSHSTYRCLLRSSLWSSSLVVNRWTQWRAAAINDRVQSSGARTHRDDWLCRPTGVQHQFIARSSTPLCNRVCGSRQFLMATNPQFWIWLAIARFLVERCAIGSQTCYTSFLRASTVTMLERAIAKLFRDPRLTVGRYRNTVNHKNRFLYFLYHLIVNKFSMWL